MSILVLGGAGYIGSHTALELIRTGESVIIADNLATGHIEAVPKDAKFYTGLICMTRRFLIIFLKTNR